MAPGANRWPRAAWITYLVAILMIAGTVSVGAVEEGRVGSEKAPAAETAAASIMAIDDIATTDLTGTLDPADLVAALTGSAPGLTISNVGFTGAEVAAGTFAGGPFGLASGVILSSGDVANIIGPNTADNVTLNNGLPGDEELDGLIPGYTTRDATVLEFQFECDTVEGFSFDYVFASDEYNEYVDSAFNDVFGFFFDESNIALVPGTTTPVAINNVNGGNPFGSGGSYPALYNNNDLSDGGPFFNTEADGFVDVLTAGVAGLTPGPHTIRLAIADAGDWILDSWVMLEAGSFQCVPPNEPPVADPNGPYTGAPGVDVVFDGTGSYDPEGEPLRFDWDFGDGSPVAVDVGPMPTHAFATSASYAVCLTVTDPAGLSDTSCTTAVINAAPVADPNGPYLLDINDVMFDGSGSYDPDGDPLVFDWDFGDGTSALDAGDMPGHTYAAPGIYTVCLTVTDPGLLTDTVCTDAVIYDPAGGFVTGGGWIDSPVGAYYPQDLPFFDGSYYELFSAPEIPWAEADDLVSQLTSAVCGYPHLATPTTAEEDEFIVNAFGTEALFGKWIGGLQDPDGVEPDGGWGWVTGEPWIYTNWNGGEPNNAGGDEEHLEYWDNGTWNDEGYLPLVTGYLVEYDECYLPEGKANFGFVAKYKKGADVPVGNTEFQFHAAGLNFHSTSYDWLVVTGNDTAKFKGVGTINGEGAYNFQLWAGDGTGTDGADTFRIKIWYEMGGTEIVVYDNGMHQDIAGGSIIVHTKK